MDDITKLWQDYEYVCARTRSCTVEPRTAWEEDDADPSKLVDRNRRAIVDASLGMVGELAELLMAIDLYEHAKMFGDPSAERYRINAILECGDVVWYCCEMSDAVGVTMRPVPNADRVDNKESAMYCIGCICDSVKKWLAQGHALDVDEIAFTVENAAASVLGFCEGATGAIACEVIARNTGKLRRRYPDGFSAERSVNRED